MYSVDPESAHAYVLAGILFTAAPFVLAQVLGWGSMFDSPGLLIAAGILALIIVFLFARIMTAKSLKGVRTKVEILGFQEFINRVDADRLQRMPPDTFEKFLPYAMALGIENRWAKAFQGITQNQPTWYVGPTPYMGFNPIFFAVSMHAMATDAHQAFVAAPARQQRRLGMGRWRWRLQRRRLRRRRWRGILGEPGSFMQNAGKPTKPKPISAETIARLAERGRDVSRFFTNRGRTMPPIQTSRKSGALD